MLLLLLLVCFSAPTLLLGVLLPPGELLSALPLLRGIIGICLSPFSFSGAVCSGLLAAAAAAAFCFPPKRRDALGVAGRAAEGGAAAFRRGVGCLRKVGRRTRAAASAAFE